MPPRGDEPLLALKLSLRDGRVYLVLEDHALGRGVRVRALEVLVPGVEFPVDLSGGAARFQHHSSRLQSVVIEIDPPALTQALSQALRGPVQGISLDGSGVLNLSARIATVPPPPESCAACCCSPAARGSSAWSGSRRCA
jgi:hypothetical protein